MNHPYHFWFVTKQSRTAFVLQVTITIVHLSLLCSVTFLDTRLRIEDDGTISSELYSKPTDMHQYLLPMSNHPPHVHKHLPYGLALRTRQIVSREDRLRIRLRELKSYVLSRGYDATALDAQICKALAVTREDALACKTKDNTSRVPLVCTWNEHLPDLGTLLRQFFPILSRDTALGSCFSSSPLLSYRRQRNLRDLLVHTEHVQKTHQDNDAESYPCKKSRLPDMSHYPQLAQCQTIH